MINFIFWIDINVMVEWIDAEKGGKQNAKNDALSSVTCYTDTGRSEGVNDTVL